MQKKHARLAKGNEKGSGIAHVFVKEVDASLSWGFLTWLRTVTKLPIYVKVLACTEEYTQEEQLCWQDFAIDVPGSDTQSMQKCREVVQGRD